MVDKQLQQPITNKSKGEYHARGSKNNNLHVD